MNTPFGDFSQFILHQNNTDNVDMTFKCKLDLSYFCDPTIGNIIENYKKQCNYKERVTLLYFIKAMLAYQAMKKMLTLHNKYGTIVNHRVDSDIISRKELSNYINETYNSFFEANIALELMTEKWNTNAIFLKIIQNSEKDFVSSMEKIALKEKVILNGI